MREEEAGLSQGDGAGEEDPRRVEPLPQRAAEGGGHGDLMPCWGFLSDSEARKKKKNRESLIEIRKQYWAELIWYLMGVLVLQPNMGQGVYFGPWKAITLEVSKAKGSDHEIRMNQSNPLVGQLECLYWSD